MILLHKEVENVYITCSAHFHTRIEMIFILSEQASVACPQQKTYLKRNRRTAPIERAFLNRSAIHLFFTTVQTLY